MRIIWLSAGLISFALGAIGAVLPLLPTVPFMLLATFCFARSSSRLHGWLINHRIFGPSILAWQEDGSINRKTKLIASSSILMAFGVSLWLDVPDKILIIQAITLSAVTLFIWSRPENRP